MSPPTRASAVHAARCRHRVRTPTVASRGRASAHDHTAEATAVTPGRADEARARRRKRLGALPQMRAVEDRRHRRSPLDRAHEARHGRRERHVDRAFGRSHDWTEGRSGAETRTSQQPISRRSCQLCQCRSYPPQKCRLKIPQCESWSAMPVGHAPPASTAAVRPRPISLNRGRGAAGVETWGDRRDPRLEAAGTVGLGHRP